MRKLIIFIAVLLAALPLRSQIAPGALHRLIGNPAATSSGNIPPTDTLARWWHAADLPNGSVTNWVDKIGGVSFYSTGHPPTATNGYVSFNGTQYLLIDSLKPVLLGSAIYCFIWSRASSAVTMSMLADTNAVSGWGLHPKGTIVYFYANNWNCGFSGFNNADYSIVDLYYSGANGSVQWFTNGIAASGTINYQTFGTNAFYLGYSPWGEWYLTDSRIYDILIYTNSTVTISNIHNWATNAVLFAP